MNIYGHWTVGYTISLGLILEMWIFTPSNATIIQFKPKFFIFTSKWLFLLEL